MTYIILRRPHALDPVWSLAIQEFTLARSGMDALGDDFTDADLNSAGERITRAVRAICALPARNADDVSLKLTAMSDGNQVRNDCDLNAAIDELCNVLSDGIRAGHAHEKGIDA